MATLNYAFNSTCEGGGHIAIDVTLNGVTGTVWFLTDTLVDPVPAFAPEDKEALARLILKAHFAGNTRAQMRSELEATGGVDVTA